MEFSHGEFFKFEVLQTLGQQHITFVVRGIPQQQRKLLFILPALPTGIRIYRIYVDARKHDFILYFPKHVASVVRKILQQQRKRAIIFPLCRTSTDFTASTLMYAGTILLCNFPRHTVFVIHKIFGNNVSAPIFYFTLSNGTGIY